MDPEKTIPPAEKAKATYLEAERWTDAVLGVLIKSPVTWVVLLGWSLGCFVLGAVFF